MNWELNIKDNGIGILKEENIVKRITDSELLELPFGSKIRVIWHNSNHHPKNDEYYGIIFGDKIGYEDGEFDEVEDFDAYGHACLSNDSIAARIITLYSPIVKSFRLAKQADENINFERNILWRA